MTIQSLILAANAGVLQDFFEQPLFTPVSPAQLAIDDVNTGLLNVFEYGLGRTNCSDATAVFGDTQTFLPEISDRSALPLGSKPTYVNLWSCAFFTNLTDEFRGSRLAAEDQASVLHRKVDTSSSTAAEVTSTLATCLTAWCEGSDECPDSSCHYDGLVLSNTTLSAAALDKCITNICAADPERISNADISGIGVITSMNLQLAISIMLLAVPACLPIFTYLLGHPRYKNVANYEATIKRTKKSFLRVAEEFQHAQCCFAIAIGIATLITLARSNGNISYTDKGAISIATLSGMIPTAATLCTITFLDRNRKHFTYTFFLTLCTWTFSLGIRFHPHILRRTPNVHTYIGAKPAACGLNPPVFLCGHNPGSDINSFDLITNFVVLFNMFTLAFISFTHNSTGYVKVAAGLTMRISYATSILASIMEFLLIFTYIADGKVNKEWSFGQVVAVTVWLPTLISFLNYCVYPVFQQQWRVLSRRLGLVRKEEDLPVYALGTVVKRRRSRFSHPPLLDLRAVVPVVPSSIVLGVRRLGPGGYGVMHGRGFEGRPERGYT